MKHGKLNWINWNKQRFHIWTASLTQPANLDRDQRPQLRPSLQAEKAALLTRAAALENKQALKLPEVELKTKMERMDLETDIAASAAKIKVLQSSDMDMDDGQWQGDGMNGLSG